MITAIETKECIVRSRHVSGARAQLVCRSSAPYIYIYTRYDVLFFYGVPQLDINMDSNTVVGNSNTEPHVGFDFHFARYFPALQRYFLVSSLQTSTAIGL